MDRKADTRPARIRSIYICRHKMVLVGAYLPNVGANKIVSRTRGCSARRDEADVEYLRSTSLRYDYPHLEWLLLQSGLAYIKAGTRRDITTSIRKVDIKSASSSPLSLQVLRSWPP